MCLRTLFISVCILVCISYVIGQDCSGHGNLTTGSNLSPQQSSTTFVCVCEEGYAGNNCQYGKWVLKSISRVIITDLKKSVVQQELFGTTFDVTVPASGFSYVQFNTLVDEDYYDLEFEVTSDDACNNRGFIRLRYGCGSCVPSYPVQLNSANPSEVKYLYDFMFNITKPNEIFAISLFDTPSRTNCGCLSNNETWYIEIDSSFNTNDCRFNITASHPCKSTIS